MHLRIYRACILLLLLLVAVVAVVSTPRNRWSVLIYMGADNELDRYAMNNIHEMEAVAPPADAVDAAITVLVQLDRANTNTAPGTWTDTRRYRIVRDPAMSRFYAEGIYLPPIDAFTATGYKPWLPPAIRHLNLPLDAVVPQGPPTSQSEIASPRLDNPQLGELDMGNPNTLRQFICWGQQTAPAQHYLVIVWGHGCGWMLEDDALREPEGKSKAFCEDDGEAQDVTSINSAELTQALKGVRHIDVLAMDNCMMSMLEVAYEIRRHVDYLVASEEEIPDRGFYYCGIIGALARAHGEMTPAQVATYLAGDTCYTWQRFGIRESLTLSAVRPAKTVAVVRALDRLARLLIASGKKYAPALRRARTEGLQFGMVTDHNGSTDLIDLGDYLQRLNRYLDDPTLHRATRECAHAIHDCVIANYTSQPYVFARGLSIYLPPATTMNPLYTRTYGAFALCKHSAWEKWLAVSP